MANVTISRFGIASNNNKHMESVMEPMLEPKLVFLHGESVMESLRVYLQLVLGVGFLVVCLTLHFHFILSPTLGRLNL
jgi:hypothetical protein